MVMTNCTRDLSEAETFQIWSNGGGEIDKNQITGNGVYERKNRMNASPETGPGSGTLALQVSSGQALCGVLAIALLVLRF
ncbi:hypothetical protein RUM43_013435 [Polyplax serrata]|uniref:Uncharacterized protein n=1 Tax=Polyplax serrata TaxID=468196 RepID=A0AAN8Q2S9_POLSC